MDTRLDGRRAAADVRAGWPARSCAVTARRWYAARAEAVLDAWLDPVVASSWLFATATRPLRAAMIDARPGGALRLATPGGDVVTGRVDAIVRASHLHCTLDCDTGRTTVTAAVSAAAGGTLLCVCHAGIPMPRADWLEARWTGMLYGLAEALDCDSHEPFDLELR